MTQSLDLYTVAFKMFGSLGFVLLIISVIFLGFKRFTRKDMTGFKEKMIQVLANYYLGNKKSIMILKVPGAILVVGVANDSINLLTHIKNEDLSQMSTDEGKAGKENLFLNTLLCLSSKKIKSRFF